MHRNYPFRILFVFLTVSDCFEGVKGQYHWSTLLSHDERKTDLLAPVWVVLLVHNAANRFHCTDKNTGTARVNGKTESIRLLVFHPRNVIRGGFRAPLWENIVGDRWTKP